MSPTRTPAQIGRMSRAKGVRFERDLAVALRPWFPDAKRGRDNGFRSATGAAPDLGDLDLGTPEFFVSAKADKDGATDAAWSLGAWFAECQAKASALGRSGLLIQKRPNYADPLDSWVWVQIGDLVETAVGGPVLARLPELYERPARVALRDWLALAARCGMTVADPTEKTGSQIAVEPLTPRP